MSNSIFNVDRQWEFARLYAGRGNRSATQCAIEAGYAKKSAGVTACRLLKNPDIQEQIKSWEETIAKLVAKFGDNY